LTVTSRAVATRSNLLEKRRGHLYCVSIVIACAATAGAQVLQWPTPTIAAPSI
jgi:hypothetical protein